MTLFESGESNGTVSLKDLFEGQLNIGSNNVLDLERIACGMQRRLAYNATFER